MTRVLFPVLKEPTWAHRDLVVHVPLLPRADAPIVCFAEDLPTGYAFLMRTDAPNADPRAFLPEAIRNLQARTTDVAVLPGGIAACGGKDLTAERLLDPNFLATLHQSLGPEMFVAVPHRVALYAVSATAAQKELEHFVQIVRFEAERGPNDGHAPVSQLAFRVASGRVVDASPLDAIRTRPAVAAAPVASRVRHPRELVLIDVVKREIEASVVLLGSGGKRFGRALFAATGGAASGPEMPGEMEHFSMKLGAIRDWSTGLFLYALDGSSDTILRAGPGLVSSANAVILVQGSAPRLEPALAAMAKKAREGKAMLAFVGPESALAELVRDAGVRPDLVSHEGEKGAMTVLKEITKHVLGSLRK